ncbi:hypothetical protein [Deinococcus kurensis]|uniref:hypothetical protein n=1 Tax=Deinococcus kurensis TaxID=2662757 RepID=UPI0012D34082|nr:hypothetical protein [Deinococcus kurensis]
MRPDLPAPLRFLAFDFDGTLIAVGLSAWHVHAHPRVRERALAGGAALSVAALADLPRPS